MPNNETKSGAAKAAEEKKVTSGNSEKTGTDVGDAQETPQTTGDAKGLKEVSTSAETQPVAEVPAVPEEMVEVSKTDLAAFVKRLGDLEESNKKLLSVADKGRMHQLNEKERAGQRLLPTVKVTRLGSATGKMVLAWNLTKNQSYVDGNRLVELQEMEVFYVDGTNETMPLITFYRTQNKDTVGKILSRTRDEDGTSEMLKLELPSGELLEIDLKFVN